MQLKSSFALQNMTQEDDGRGVVATMFQLFNFTCRTHISVMALKMHIQRNLFNESALTNKCDNFAEKVVYILSSLETAAATLQEIQVRNIKLHNISTEILPTSCVQSSHAKFIQ